MRADLFLVTPCTTLASSTSSNWGIPFTMSYTTCDPATHFACADGSGCILRQDVCDGGTPHCADGSDEQGCTSTTTTTTAPSTTYITTTLAVGSQCTDDDGCHRLAVQLCGRVGLERPGEWRACSFTRRRVRTTARTHDTRPQTPAALTLSVLRAPLLRLPLCA